MEEEKLLGGVMLMLIDLEIIKNNRLFYGKDLIAFTVCLLAFLHRKDLLKKLAATLE